MKFTALSLRQSAFISLVFLGVTCAAHAQFTLTGTSYFQNFDSLGTANESVSLPNSWSVTDNASLSSLGTLVSSVGRNTWADTAGGARNVASSTGHTGSESASNQHTFTNRALGYRQGSSVGDPGAAFVFHANTTGLGNFSLSFDFMTLDVETRSTTFSVQVSINGTDWTTLTTVADSSSFGSQSVSASSITPAIDNQSSVYFRIAALSAASGSGSRDTIAVDNFQLNYSAIPELANTVLLTGLATVMGCVAMRRRR